MYTAPTDLPNTDPPHPTHLGHLLDTLPPSKAWAAQHLSRTDDGQNFAHAIQTGTAITVSDGSYKTGYGTAAFILTDTLVKSTIRGVLSVPGPLAEGDSHRCELAGMYAILVTT